MGEGSHFSSGAGESSRSLIQRLNYAKQLPQVGHVWGSQNLIDFAQPLNCNTVWLDARGSVRFCVQSKRIGMDITNTEQGESKMRTVSSFVFCSDWLSFTKVWLVISPFSFPLLLFSFASCLRSCGIPGTRERRGTKRQLKGCSWKSCSPSWQTETA